MYFRQLFDDATSTFTYVLADETTKEAVIIDPVREQLDNYRALLDDEGFTLKYLLDTHVHADHVTGAGLLQKTHGGQTGVSAKAGVSCANLSLDHGQTLTFGHHTLEARATPGHTAGCMTYVVPDAKAAFTGDTLLIEGSGRTDFQQGDATTLFKSVRDQIFSLPDDFTLYPGHDYKGRTQTTVAHEKEHNPRVGLKVTEAEFLTIMDNLKLAYPRFIDEALPLNLQCGILDMSGDWANVRISATGVPEVTPRWVLGKKGEVKIVDVRGPDEFWGPLGHVLHSELVPLPELMGAAEGWDKDDTYVLVCRSGGRSGKAAMMMKEMGFAHAVSMNGGMLRWNDEGLPIFHNGLDAPTESTEAHG